MPQVAAETTQVITPSKLPGANAALISAWRKLRSWRPKFGGSHSLSFATSAVVHGAVLLILAIFVYEQLGEKPGPALLASMSEDPVVDMIFTGPIEVDGEDSSGEEISTPKLLEEPTIESPGGDIAAELESLAESPDDIAMREAAVAASRFGRSESEEAESADQHKPIGNWGGSLDGRSIEARRWLVNNRGGSKQSEEAVERGLRWIAEHQFDDGSWHFDLTNCPRCRGYCSNSGHTPTTTGATALALLPFLGAGYTHREGPYQETVARGLTYLISRAKSSPKGADFQEGTMYAQGLSAIALCEAYNLTKDPDLRDAAQKSIYFIQASQHAEGGWRYFPGQVGDTTVTGWQIMALKSGQLAGLEVQSPVLQLADRFLDGVQSEYGSAYGYQNTDRRDVTTAVGLLCRMYLGWPRDQHPLEAGLRTIGQKGPSKTNLYYDYYATQALCHYDGPLWRSWNQKMRDHLIATQSDSGHEAGSWWFPDKETKAGGRLYNTAIAVLILEVYYRYLPLYSREAWGAWQ